VGIQIVYGNVSKAVEKAESQKKPLLVYSWVPRAEIMTPGRFVRLVLASFYHCGNALNDKSELAEDLARAVAACDFAVEHVEKAVVWRLQQPGSTTATLFINAFQLNWDQLQDLLHMGEDLDSSSPTADLDNIACQWLVENPAVWQRWMPTPDSTVLRAWPLWLGFSSLCFFLIFYEAGMYFWGVHRESHRGVVIKNSAPEAEGPNAQHTATSQFKWAESRKLPNGLLNEVLASMKDPPQQATSPEASLSGLVPNTENGLDERSSGSSSSSAARLALAAKFRGQFRPAFHFLREACRWCLFHKSSYQIYAFALGQVGAQVSIGKYWIPPV
jgi:hypothetical protein